MSVEKNTAEKLFLAVIVAIFPGIVFLAVYTVGRQFWMDDTHSTHHAFAGFGGVVDNLRTDSHPPLYFLFLAAWMKVAGLKEVWLRLPSILVTLAGGFVLFREGRRFDDRRLPWMFALFFVFNPIVVAHMHTVRPYALAGLLAALSTVEYLRLASTEDRGERGQWVRYLVFNSLGTLTLYWFFFLLAGQAAGATLFARGRKRAAILLAIAGSAVPFAVFWTPILLEQLQGTPTSWMEVPGGFWILHAPLELIGGADPYEFSKPAGLFYGLLALACVLRFRPRPGLVTLTEVRTSLLDRRIGLLLALPVSVILISLTVSQITPVYLAKYTIVVSPALAMLFGLLLGRLGERILVPLVCAFFLVASVLYRDDGLVMELAWDNRNVTQYIVDNYEDGDELVHISLSYAPTLHYLRALAPTRSFSQTVFPEETVNHVGWEDQLKLLEDTVSLRTEARDLVERLRNREDPGRVWFLADFEHDPVFTDMLEEEIRKAFTLEQTVSLRGWWISEIQVYSPDDEPSTAGDPRSP